MSESFESRQQEHYQSVSSQFRVGNPETTREIVAEGIRYLLWERSPDDKAVAKYAGWKNFAHNVGEDVCSLVVPHGTRSAASVLSGVEAWRGEKEAVFLRAAGYVRDTLRDTALRGVDGNLSFYTMAVTRDQQVVFTPPHNLVTEPDEISMHLDQLRQEAAHIFGDRAGRQSLIVSFEQDLRGIIANKGRR